MGHDFFLLAFQEINVEKKQLCFPQRVSIDSICSEGFLMHKLLRFCNGLGPSVCKSPKAQHKDHLWDSYALLRGGGVGDYLYSSTCCL